MTVRMATPLLLGFSLACASARVPPDGNRASDPGAVVLARGEGVTITAAEFRSRLAEQSETVRARFSTPENRREFLDNLVKFELLVAEARRQGLDRDPEIQLAMEKLMVVRLVRGTLGMAEGEKATQEKQQAFDAFIGSLRTRANVQLNTQALDAMTVDPADPAPTSVAK
jgi:hypothetical protein